MEDDGAVFGQNVQVVDPDVRAYVYSLVTAVSCSNALWGGRDVANGPRSSVVSTAKMRIDMFWETMRWHAYEISSGG